MDDLVQLKSDNTFQYTDAGQTCAGSTNMSGSWSLSGTAFMLDGESRNVESFNGSTTVLKQTETAYGLTVTTVSTITKQ